MSKKILKREVTLLIIDDDPTILETLKFLMENEGFIIKTAQTGDDAFLILKQFSPDMILLDITMPKMDGFEVCKVIKENPETKHIPVIFFTGIGEEMGAKLQSLMVGGVDYICKPFQHNELLEKIKNHLKII